VILVIKHISIEGPGTAGDFFEDKGRKIRTIELDRGQDLPPDLSKIEAVILLGGPMNVYEEGKYPFLKDEDAFLKKAIRENVPTLGICLGAQLLAKACGVKVKKAKEKEIGWYKVSSTDEGRKDPLLAGIASEFDAFQWHEDTFEIPSDAALLATSNSCRNQAVRFCKNIYGLQFHIEVTGSMIKDWVKEYTESSDPRSQQRDRRMLAQYTKVKEKFNKVADLIYRNFETLMKT